MTPKTFSFQVDLPGLIDLMGTALYSRPSAAVRELIQNAHDGIIRRRFEQLDFQGKIRFVQNANSKTLKIIDDGIGLDAEEAEKYLGTLGIGITGMMRRSSFAPNSLDDSLGLIGQFGIGLLSVFLIADKITVESLKNEPNASPICWEADHGTTIRLSDGTKTTPGTEITLQLRPDQLHFANSEDAIEEAVRMYADFLNVPIFLNDRPQRLNVMNPTWFVPEADDEELLLALETRFHETPLSVIPIRREKPIAIQGALYISPQRLPGFTDESLVAVTIHRMIISQRIQGLMPPWAPFVRGVLEVSQCRPTASREELVRDENFQTAKNVVEEILFDYFEKLAHGKPHIWEALLNWHRYTFAGSALENERLRKLLRKTYLFSTHRGKLTFDNILEKCATTFTHDDGPDYVIWYHGDRRQESAIDSIFSELKAPCVHACLMFEEALLGAMSDDAAEENRVAIECRVAVPGTKGFSTDVLGASNVEPLDDSWNDFFGMIDAKIHTGECESSQAVYAFLNERQDLVRTIESLKKGGVIPSSFQRMIDRHLDGEELPRNEILLNRRHPLVSRTLSQSTSFPLASVLRVLVFQNVQSAGAQLPREAHEQIDADLQWVAETFYKNEA